MVIDKSLLHIHFCLANTYFLVNDFDMAIIHYAKVAKKNPSKFPDVYFNLGNALTSKGNYKEAEKCYKLGLKDNNNKHKKEIMFNLGNCKFALNKFEKAIFYYESCIKLNFSPKELKFALAKAYLENNLVEFTEKAETIMETCCSEGEIEISKMTEENDNMKFLYLLAVIKHKLNKLQEAKEIFKVKFLNNEFKFLRKF